MTGAPASSPGIPSPLDDDDDDVAWALQTAAVQWKRDAFADALVWLRRAVESAVEVGNAARAGELGLAASELARAIESAASPPPVAWPPPGLEAAPEPARPGPPPLRRPLPSSVEVTVDDTDVVAAADLTSASEPVSAPPQGFGADFEDEPTTVGTPFDVAPASERPPPGEPPPRGSMPTADDDEVVTSARYYEFEVKAPPAPSHAASAPAPPAPAPSHAASAPAPPAPAPAPPAPAPAAPTGDGADELRVEGVVLSEVRGLEDLPDEAQLELVRSVTIETLAAEDEIGSFSVALVLGGSVAIMPAITDAACARAAVGEVVFTRGSLEEGVALRVVAGDDGARVAVWGDTALEAATADCPWVADELRVVADRFQALAGASMGELGDRFDEALRARVTDRCEVRALSPGDLIVEQGKPVSGLYIIGAGRVEIGDEAAPEDELGPGDFLFAAQVLTASPAPTRARAGKGGALVLFAERHAAHELMVSVPPLLEILAG
ncbi:MAG: cyclic nucleotide-binding domain-containing protein [Sorangiineae bacterium]|nr:cyclic nucleotide-binding domain-containing protein [Sorangiineae bacterium]